MRRNWTARQARYDAATLTVDTPEYGLTRHYVTTLHGTVARTWCSTDYAEVALWRPTNRGATYQGHVAAVPGGWQAFDTNRQPVSAVHADYLDAEAPLLLRRTRRRSRAAYTWPRHLRPTRRKPAYT